MSDWAAWFEKVATNRENVRLTATNKVVTGATNNLPSKVSDSAGVAVSVVGVQKGATGDARAELSEVVSGASGRTLNRRNRADYNAYQREYMKKRREK